MEQGSNSAGGEIAGTESAGTERTGREGVGGEGSGPERTGRAAPGTDLSPAEPEGIAARLRRAEGSGAWAGSRGAGEGGCVARGFKATERAPAIWAAAPLTRRGRCPSVSCTLTRPTF